MISLTVWGHTHTHATYSSVLQNPFGESSISIHFENGASRNKDGLKFRPSREVVEEKTAHKEKFKKISGQYNRLEPENHK